MRAPVSMRSEDVRKVYTVYKTPQDSVPAVRRESTSSPGSVVASIDEVAQSKLDSSWTFDSPSTMLFAKQYPDPSQLPGIGQNRQRGSFDTSPYLQAGAAGGTGSHTDYTSPGHHSESSTSNEPWPPFISNGQTGWRPATVSDSQQLDMQASGRNNGYASPAMNDMQRMYLADTPAPQMPINTPMDDAMMPDIDWVSSLCYILSILLTRCRMNGTSSSLLR